MKYCTLNEALVSTLAAAMPEIPPPMTTIEGGEVCCLSKHEGKEPTLKNKNDHSRFQRL